MAEASQSDEKLDLKVSDSHGALTHFKVKKTTKFRKILTAYASKAGIEERAIRLMVDGERVNLEQCPGDLDMENGDQIDAMVEQQGGLGQDPAAAAGRGRAARQPRAPGRDRGGARARDPSHAAATLREREAIKRQAHRARRRAGRRAVAGKTIGPQARACRRR